MLKNKKILFAAWSCHNKNYHAYHMWDSPLKKIFGKVITFDPQEVIYKDGKDEMNKKFLEVLEKEKPDYLFLWLIYEEFYLETLEKIKEISPKTKIVNFCGDDDLMFNTSTIYLFPFIDYFLYSQLQFSSSYKKYNKKIFFGGGVDTSIFKPMKTKYLYDSSFVGGPKGDRAEQIKYLIDNNIKFSLFGRGWDKHPEVKSVYKGEADHNDFSKIINSTKVNICFTKNHGGTLHMLLERVFAINACNAFGLIEYCDEYLNIFKKNKNIAFFKDKNDLVNKINYYLKNDSLRDKIANEAYKFTVPKYSNYHLLLNMFNSVAKSKEDKNYSFPNVKNRVIYLDMNQLTKLNKSDLIKLIDGKEYIGFINKSKNLPFKEEMQIYGINLLNKPMGCCNSYYNSSLIGNYFSASMNFARNSLSKNEFNELFDISQLLVKRDYFMSHINQFKNILLYNHNDFITNKNTSFVNFPLVEIKKSPYINPDKISYTLNLHFEDKFRCLKSDNRLFTNIYTYLFCLKCLINKMLWKYSLKKIRKLF